MLLKNENEKKCQSQYLLCMSVADVSIPQNYLCAQGLAAPGGKGDALPAGGVQPHLSSSQCSSKTAPRDPGLSYCKITALGTPISSWKRCLILKPVFELVLQVSALLPLTPSFLS